MSFVISNKQYLAPTEERIQYEPMSFEEEGITVERLDVSFGHPLYTAATEILYIESATSDRKYAPIIPDGCISLVLKGKKNSEEPLKGYLCGVIDEIKKINVEPEDYYIIIRFMPGTGYSIIRQGKSANVISNQAITIADGMVGAEQIAPVLERDIQLIEKVGLISKMIRVCLQEEPERYIIKYCTDRIFESQGNVRIETLADETGFTSRHIGKLFERCIGVSPKLYSQIIKLQISMKRIILESSKPLMEIAVDCGFFDHAHMNRMYKKFIKLSTGEFRKALFSKLDYTFIDDYISEIDKR